MKTTRCAIYTRLSLDKQKGQEGAGLGVERQRDACLELAARLGWQVVAHYDDNDTSAYNPRKRRKGYEALLDAMKNNAFDSIICWHTDRLYRRLNDLERLIQIAEANDIDIRTVQGGDLDLSTSAGRMVARILGSVSNAESEHKGERHRAANVQKAQMGKWQTANRSFGYTAEGHPLEPEASAVRQAVTDVLAGKSIQGIAKQWNEAGLRTTLAGTTRNNPHTGDEFVVEGSWAAPSVRRLLINPRYAALKVHQGKVVGPGNWTPLIDADTHQGVVALLSDPARVRCTSFERKYLGSGLYRCGVCDDGTLMKAAKPGGRTNRAYSCRKHSHLLRAGEPLDDFVTAHVLERMTRENAVDLLANQGVDVTDLGVKLEALQRKLDRTTQMFNDDAIGSDQFAEISRSTRSKMALIEQQLAEATRVSPAAALVAAGAGAWQLWQDMTPAQRAQAVDEVAVVTVLPCPRGRRPFDPNYVRVEWRRGDPAP